MNAYHRLLFSLIIGSGIIAFAYSCSKTPERCDVMKTCRTCEDCKNNESCRQNCYYCESCEECSNFTGNDIKTPEYIVQPGMMFSPCYNPNNNNEIAYFRHDKNTGIISLNTYNFIAKAETVALFNALVFGPNNAQIQWKQPNILTFIRTDGNIYSVNSNGTNINPVTRIPTYTHHAWKNDSTIVAEFSLNGGNGFFHKAVINVNTMEVDTVNNDYFKFGAFRPDGSYVYVKRNDSKNIFIRYTNEEERRLTDNLVPDRDSITGLAWHPGYENILFTTFRGGIFSVNIETKQTYKIRTGCDTRSYRHITISPDGKQMVVQRVDAHENTSNAKWEEEHSLYLMDINGKNETQILP